jgi:hypothetical protein
MTEVAMALVKIIYEGNYFPLAFTRVAPESEALTRVAPVPESLARGPMIVFGEDYLELL